VSNLRPDQLSGVSGLADSDILIAEINPNDVSRKVVKITKGDLLSGISGASASGITALSNIGVGSGIASGVIGSDGYLKSLIGGTNLQIVGDENSLTFNVTGISGSSSSGITGATNLGAGSGLVSGISNDDLQIKSLVGGTNLQITGDSESLYLDVTGVSSAFTGSVIKMTGCTLYASGDQVGINTCEPADGYSLHVSGATAASGNLDVYGDVFSYGTWISGTYFVGIAAKILADQDIGGNLLVGDTLTLGKDYEYPGGDGNLIVYGDEGITIGPFEGGTSSAIDESGSMRLLSGIYLPTLNTVDRDNINIERDGLLIYNAEEEQFQGYNGTAWVNLGSGSSGSSTTGITGATNLGAGSGLISGITDNDLQVKSLVGGTNLQITGDGESLYLNVTGISGSDGSGVSSFTGLSDTPSSFEANQFLRVSSDATGLIYNDLSGVISSQEIAWNVYSTTSDLPNATDHHGMFAHVHSEDAAYMAHAGNWVKIYPLVTGAEGLGDGSGVFKDISSYNLQFKSLLGGDNVRITGDGSTLTFDVTGISGGSTTGITGATNLGAGSGLISGVTNNDLQVKSLIGGTNLQITGDGESLYLNVTGVSGGSGGSGITGASNIGAGDGLVSGVLNDDIKVKSLIGGSNISLSASANSITINSIGGGGGGGAGGTFAFFSNALNNAGIIEKTYYPTVDPNIYLSGIDVDNASDLTLYLRWDGPGNGYMGTGFINGQEIPTGNITQLGTSTRRFEGFISGLDLAGTTIITGIANGSTGTISLQEAGAGPTPFSVFMPPVSSGTAKAGTNLGSSDYKGGDTTTGYVTFDTTDVTGIKVFDHGVSDFIDFTSYTLVDTGDARHTARIPLTINNTRNGSQTLKVIAVNNFGTTGAATESNAVTLDQTYPSVSATDPALGDYVNNQGLNSGESITFVNTISNWDSANGDTVLYSGLSDQISITDSGVFQNPKTVSYVTGVFNNSDNITITAARDDNGAVDSTDVKIRIAKNPIITGIILQPYALSATSPNVVGTSEIKGGDVGSAEVVVNTNEVSAGNMTFSVSNAGVSDGSQTAYTSASSSTTLPDGTIVFAINLNITSSIARDGAQSVTVTARNNFGTTSPSLTSAASATVNNAEFPSLTAGPVSYPANQSALKDTESATVTNTAATYDTIIYTSPGSELDISNPNTFEGSKNVDRLGGTYNISTDNFTATATKASNGMVRDVSTVVNIANTAAAFTINNLASSIQINTGQSVIDNFDLDINQILYENPALYLDYTQVPQSTLTATAQGTGTTANNYRITVAPDDGKGEFTFSGSGLNLAGKETFAIGTNPNYIISGIVEGEAYISDQSPCAGLIYLGGPMINPSTISMENVSEGGAGPNAGTIYTYQAYANGTSVDCTTDADNKFAIVTSGAGGGIGTLLTNTTGDHLFNLDQTNRQANTSSPGALIVISQT
jgi:hypothetical protein